MIRRQLINFGSKSTDFRMGFGALCELPRMVSGLVTAPNRAFVLTDSDLETGPGLEVFRALIDSGFTVTTMRVATDPSFASVDEALSVYRALGQAGITCDDLVVAYGGRGVCDLATFCSRTWCGETSYLLVPSGLDGMVTAATGVAQLACPGSEDLVTMEPRAAMVVCDLDLVARCDESALKLGYVELLAASLIDSRRSWERFASLLPRLVLGEEIAIFDALGMAQTSRVGVLNSSNPSAKNALQFGVTTARALRSCLDSDAPWYALLAEGMRFESRLAHDVCGFDIQDVFDLDDRLFDLGVDDLEFHISRERFIDALRESRFKRSNRFMFSLPRHPGTVRYSVVDHELLERHADAYLASRSEAVD